MNQSGVSSLKVINQKEKEQTLSSACEQIGNVRQLNWIKPVLQNRQKKIKPWKKIKKLKKQIEPIITESQFSSLGCQILMKAIRQIEAKLRVVKCCKLIISAFPEGKKLLKIDLTVGSRLYVFIYWAVSKKTKGPQFNLKLMLITLLITSSSVYFSCFELHMHFT